MTLRSVGIDGGQAAAFTYDLARSVVYTRQGNPAWAARSATAVTPIRSDDLFFGAQAGDLQPDWVDLNKVAIPQADEQQRLLANLIAADRTRDKKPLPRFWYFPRRQKAVVVMTGDDHGNGGTAGPVRPVHRRQPARLLGRELGVRPRHVVHLPRHAAHRRRRPRATSRQGFEIGAARQHRTAPTGRRRSLADASTRTQLDAVRARATRSVPAPVTNRTHCIVWSDWSTQPQVELDNGIRLDTNYYYWPPAWIQDRPGMFTGSGMPMRFADVDGTMIDVYQATTQMTDESGQTYPVHDRHAARQRARPAGLLRRLHREHAHRLRATDRPGRRRDHRLGAGARRAGRLARSRCSTGSTAATGRRSSRSLERQRRSTFTVIGRGTARTDCRRCCRRHAGGGRCGADARRRAGAVHDSRRSKASVRARDGEGGAASTRRITLRRRPAGPEP